MGSLHPISKGFSGTPSVYSTRPNTPLPSPSEAFDLNVLLLKPPCLNIARHSLNLPYLPLQRLPIPWQCLEILSTESTSGLSQVAIQQLPVGSQLLSLDLNQRSPALSSDGPQTAKTLKHILGF